MGYLNVFKCRWSKRPIDKIKCFFMGFKYAYQRATRGFSDYDLSDLDMFYILTIAASLKEFTKYNIGVPNRFYIEDKPDEGLKKWHDCINEISNLFYLAAEDTKEAKKQHPYFYATNDFTKVYDDTSYESIENYYNKAMDKLKENMRDLWI